MADLTIKQHDTYPPLTAILSDQAGPVDLSGASSVKVILKSAGGTITGTCTVTSPQTGATKGQVTYTWIAADTASAGTYQLEFEVTWSTGVIQTFPNTGTKSVVIEADLG